MKSPKWIFASAALALALGMAGGSYSAMAQPGAGKANKGRRAPLIAPAMVEKVNGKPLTEEQKTAVAEAAKTYHESVAKALGITVKELEAKAKEFRKAQRTNKPAA
ncbi:hypothetical protein EON80_27550 [bacterium]|nr:MAG: hypothetical protein EON80_27550 [bacterium]